MRQTIIATETPSAKLAGAATEDEILQAYLAAGTTDIVSVPCSITDTWQWLVAQAARNGAVRLVMTNHEHNLPGIAAGLYFGTGRPALVHLQNSGLFNAGDGFVTMASPSMFGLPAVVLVTWRGWGPEETSEPHLEIGRRTRALTNVIFGESSDIFGGEPGDDILAAVRQSLARAQAGSVGVALLPPVALRRSVVGRVADTFATLLPGHLESLRREKGDASILPALRFPTTPTRDDAIRAIAAAHPDAALLFCNGYTARAGQAIVDRPGNFYNIGYMGGTLAVGWGLARSRPNLPVVVIDGDQNAQMSTMKDHLLADYPPNLSWYILNNHIGASVGTAESLPLADLYHCLARVIEIQADEPGTFPHPRVRSRQSTLLTGDANQAIPTLNSLAREFRGWVQSQS